MRGQRQIIPCQETYYLQVDLRVDEMRLRLTLNLQSKNLKIMKEEAEAEAEAEDSRIGGATLSNIML